MPVVKTPIGTKNTKLYTLNKEQKKILNAKIKKYWLILEELDAMPGYVRLQPEHQAYHNTMRKVWARLWRQGFHNACDEFYNEVR